MFVAKVTGSVVSTQKVDSLVGYKLLVVEPYRLEPKKRKSLATTGRTFVAVDTLGAGAGDYVLLTQGSSARLTEETRQLPIDAVVVGIVDQVRVEVVFAGLGRVDIVGAVVVGLGKIGTADVDRHRWVVPWPLSYTADQRVVGFLNSRSYLGWLNYIVGELFLDRQVLETCSHWWVDRWNHSTMQRV